MMPLANCVDAVPPFVSWVFSPASFTNSEPRLSGSKVPRIASRPCRKRTRGLKRQLAEKSEELEIAKSRGVLHEEPEVKYAFIEQHRQAFSVQRICVFIGVVRSGYYAVVVNRLPAAADK